MVHRPSDSRLLVNLISHEKDYSKQLGVLLEHSQASLASFSAYASASAPPTSQIIIQVAGALAGADEGFRKYAASLEIWQEQLKSLKDLEDEVGNVVRDREILVTRLIKASKNQKPTRDSLLATSGSTSSLSFGKSEVQLGSKLAAAQSELQACEAHLASKERDLDLMRTHAVRTGLQARCKALVECGWQWGEMGKEGLRALETLEIANGINGHAYQPGQLPYNKPLPDSGQSDLSSIGPSQSASQSTHMTTENPSPPRPYTLHIPPAHSISDVAFPNGTVAPLAQVDEGGESSGDEDEGQFEVHENERFSLGRGKTQSQSQQTKGKDKTRDRSPAGSSSKSRLPTSASAPQVVTRSKPRQRQNSTGVFGSIAAFFHHGKSSNAGSDDERGTYVPESYSPARSSSRWKSRTDKHLSRSKGRNSSDDELPVSYPRSLPPDPISTGQLAATPDSSTSTGSQRLKKRTVKRNTVHSPPKASAATIEDRGWASDNMVSAKSGTIKAQKKAKQGGNDTLASPTNSTPSGKGKKSKEVEILHISEQTNTPPSPSTPTTLSKSKKPNGAALSATLPTEATLSRSSSLSRQSITSAASAPVGLSSQTTTIHPAPSMSRRSASAHRRATSLDANNSHPKLDATPSKNHKRASTNAVYSAPRANNAPSLMSIVEGVAKQNREHAMKQDPSRMLFLPKAPPPVSQMLDVDNVQASPVASSPDVIESRIERAASEQSVPLTPSISSPSVPIIHQPSPEMKPLRSALRNSSRSPSPQLPIPLLSPPEIPARSTLRPTAAPTVPSKMSEQPDDGGDTASISSYETTLEMQDEAEDEDNASTPVLAFTTELPPAPPPKQVEALAHTGGSDVSQSTNSSTTAAPTRRKSVRMSLPPTFSATPPALDERDDRTVRQHEPWSSQPNGEAHHGWSSKIREGRDLWQDSSEDEDEEYSAAKRLLSKIGRKNNR